jgi:hypothetical protein
MKTIKQGDVVRLTSEALYQKRLDHYYETIEVRKVLAKYYRGLHTVKKIHKVGTNTIATFTYDIQLWPGSEWNILVSKIKLANPSKEKCICNWPHCSNYDPNRLSSTAPTDNATFLEDLADHDAQEILEELEEAPSLYDYRWDIVDYPETGDRDT